MRASWAFPSCFCLILQDNTRLKNISFLHHLCESRAINCLIAFWAHYLVVPSFDVGLSNTINTVTLHHVVKALLLVVSTDDDTGREIGDYLPRGAEQCGNRYRITQRIHDIDCVVFDSCDGKRVERFKQLSFCDARPSRIHKSNPMYGRVKTFTGDMGCKTHEFRDINSKANFSRCPESFALKDPASSEAAQTTLRQKVEIVVDVNACLQLSTLCENCCNNT